MYIFVVFCLHVTKSCCLQISKNLVKIQNEPRGLVPSVLQVNKDAYFESYETFTSDICIYKSKQIKK